MNIWLPESDVSSIRLTGAVYTPPNVAEALVKRVLARTSGDSLNILEPSVGDGSFLSPLIRIAGRTSQISAIDIDQHVIERLEEQYASSSDRLNLISQDFLTYAAQHLERNANHFDIIIGNPPFIRRHNYSNLTKSYLPIFSNIFSVDIKNLKNAWASFTVASSKMLNKNGILAFVLPYEILTVKYGHEILKMLSNSFARIEITVSDKKAFVDIDQDAVILLAEKCSDAPHGVYITKSADFDWANPTKEHKLNLSRLGLDGLELNSFLIPEETKTMISGIKERLKDLGHFASTAPGIVTAANEFFIRTFEDAKKLGISQYAKPILRKSSFISSRPVFSSQDFRQLKKKYPAAFLHFQGELSTLSKSAQDYIHTGEAQLLNERYKCRNRKHWHEVPIVKPKSGFFFKRCHSYPRILVNEAGVHTTDTAYGIEMHENYTIQGLCYSFYNSLTLLFCEINGRFYGGGVLELSPLEFRSVPIVYHEPSEAEFTNFLEVHHKSEGDIHEILDFGDELLGKKLNLSDKDIKSIRDAWKSVRAHRLRHGRNESN